MKRSTLVVLGVSLIALWCLAAVGERGWAASWQEVGQAASGAAVEAEASLEKLVADALVSLVVILIAAKLGGHFFERVRLPAVLGELIGGMILGNLTLVGFSGLEFLHHEQVIDVLAEIGVIFLLFEVGLESNLRDLMRVGLSSLLVAVAGVVAPFFLGYLVSWWFLPDEEFLVHLFIGATLCATSVGITARVLRDLGKIDIDESRIILGAAVMDDVLGLIILAVVKGMITAAAEPGSQGITGLDVLVIVAKAIAFFIGAIGIGVYVSPRLFRLASRLRGEGLLLATSVVFCFFLSWLAAEIGLAPIVGAFSAGLILDEVHYQGFLDQGEHTIEEILAPIAYFLVPVFFVLMGIKVDLRTFGQVEILGFAAVLTLAAILGKQACSLGVLQRGVNRIAVGIGMIPRGEVGLIFAGIGTTLYLHGDRVIGSETYSAVVIMVIITTLFTPPLLKWSLLRQSSERVEAEPAERSETSLG